MSGARIDASRRQRIMACIRDVPRGSVASYGQIAEMCGIRRGARQVGYVLRMLPDGHDVPWHRIVRASGEIAFADGNDAFNEQLKRLMMEGVTIRRGKVDMQQHRWQPNLDELLWKPSVIWDGNDE
jgi:methylated-DNA-protein-cysteine methyltransferase-like protein